LRVPAAVSFGGQRGGHSRGDSGDRGGSA